MYTITDSFIEDYIYIMNGGRELQWILICAGCAVILAVASMIKMGILVVWNQRAEGEVASGYRKVINILLPVGIMICAVGIPLFVVAIEKIKVSYFLANAGLAYFAFGAVILYLIITIIKHKYYKLTMFLDVFGAFCAICDAMLMVPWILLSGSCEVENWYVRTEVIADFMETTNQMNKVCIKDSDEWVQFISNDYQNVCSSLCDDEAVMAYVIYSEDGEALVSYDMVDHKYEGDKLIDD